MHIYQPSMFELTTVRDDKTGKINIESCRQQKECTFKKKLRNTLPWFKVVFLESKVDLGCKAERSSPSHRHKYTNFCSAHTSIRNSRIYPLYNSSFIQWPLMFSSQTHDKDIWQKPDIWQLNNKLYRPKCTETTNSIWNAIIGNQP